MVITKHKRTIGYTSKNVTIELLCLSSLSSIPNYNFSRNDGRSSDSYDTAVTYFATVRKYNIYNTIFYIYRKYTNTLSFHLRGHDLVTGACR